MEQKEDCTKLEQLRNDFEYTASHLEKNPSLASIATPEIKLKLYGLFKQATCGDINKQPQAVISPSFFNIKAKSKYDAWASQDGLTQEQAYRNYIQTVSLLDPSLKLPSTSSSMKSIKQQNGNNKKESKEFLLNLLSNDSKKSKSTINNNNSSLLATSEEKNSSNNGIDLIQPIRTLKKSSSLTWDVQKRTIPQRRKSEGDEFDLDDGFGDEASSDMDWDENKDGNEKKRKKKNVLYFDENEEEHQMNDYDDMDEDDDEEEEQEDKKSDEDETVLGTLLFTIPFVCAFKIYKVVSNTIFLPVTMTLNSFGLEMKEAPDNHSIQEKQQTASLLLVVSILPMTAIVYLWTFFFLIFPFTTLPTAAYIAWMLYWDDSPRNASRSPILKDVPFAKHFVNYFPITLSRQSPPLDPSGKYVFAYHPHGIIGLGSFGVFATHAAGFKEKFPGIDLRLLTLDQNFKVPIMREVLLGFGVCSCSRKSCDTILNRGPGSAICLVVGGAAESLETQSGTYRLVLGRKGFVRVAVENNADLVPVIAFGETDAFETFTAAPGTLLRELQTWIQTKIGFTVPIFWGRGISPDSFGLMPKRRPIHVVTGEPLSIAPFRAQGLQGEALVDAVHQAYVAALRRLFDENKDECEAGIKRKESLVILQ